MNPIGPEPSVVYWVRRGAIILVILTLIIGLFWLLGSRGSSDSVTPAPVGTSSALDSDGAAVAASTGAEPSGAAASDAAVSGAVTDCPDSSIKVETTTDSSTYAVGTTPRLTLTITNTGTVDCLRDVGPKANELEITSGGYHVWSSDDCNASDKSKIVTLAAGEKVGSSITWNGRLSQNGCPNTGTAAKAGRYDLVGRNETVESEATPFALTNKN
jgi:hypothetical protein